MGMAEKHLARFGANMGESLGVRPAGAQSPPQPAPPSSAPDAGRTRTRDTGRMTIENIVPDPTQPRQHFDEEELGLLAASMKSKGQLVPARVRWDAGLGKWVLLCGERRYRAALLAGLTVLDCVFLDRPVTEAEILEEQLMEQLLHRDFQPIEKAKGFRRLMNLKGIDAYTLSRQLHLSPSTVSRALALLEQPPEVQDLVEQGAIPVATAYAIRNEPDQAQVDAARAAAEKRRSRKQVDRPTPPTKTARIFDCGDARVSVKFEREASHGEVVAALEDAIVQAMAHLPQKDAG